MTPFRRMAFPGSRQSRAKMGQPALRSRLDVRDMKYIRRLIVGACDLDLLSYEVLGLLLIVQQIDRLGGGVEEHIFPARLHAGDHAILNVTRVVLLHHLFVRVCLLAKSIGDLAAKGLILRLANAAPRRMVDATRAIANLFIFRPSIE